MEKELTVKELIEKLTKIKNQNLPVNTEGCDCDGTQCDVVVEKDRVYITRDNES